MNRFLIECEDDANDERVVKKTMIVMEAAVKLNELWLLDHPKDVCFLTCDGVKYDFEKETELSNTVPIKTVPILKREKRGLCIDFVCFDVAVRRLGGQEASPHVMNGTGRGLFHVVTRVVEKDGKVTIVDPASEVANHGRFLSAPTLCTC